MNKINKSVLIIGIFIIGVLSGVVLNSWSMSSNNLRSSNNGDLFVWNPPQNDPLIIPSSNITDSATCRFKKSFNTFYGSPKITNSNTKQQPDSIIYSYDDDNEADTVTFIDLNTQQPKVKINTGQSELKVLNDNSESITLIALSAIDKSSHGSATYKIFKHKGILIYTDSFDGGFLAGPTGTLEMGYCS